VIPIKKGKKERREERK